MRLTRRFGKGGVALVLALAFLWACSPNVVQHGNVVNDEELARIEPGVTTREEVTRILGSPSAAGTFDDKRWYYVMQQTEVRSFFQKNIKAQEVVAIDFDENGRVRDVQRSGIEQAQAVDPSPEETRTLGNEISLLEQLLGNIGRFETEEAVP